jgi:hypothetical protein
VGDLCGIHGGGVSTIRPLKGKVSGSCDVLYLENKEILFESSLRRQQQTIDKYIHLTSPW